MANNNLQEPLQALSPMLNHIVTEAIGEDLARQRRDRNARRLALENVAEVLEVGISPAHTAVAELERGDVGAAQDLVVCVHVAAHAVGAGVPDLGRWLEREREKTAHAGLERQERIQLTAKKSKSYFYLQEVLWRAIDLFEALLARIWHCLHDCQLVARGLLPLENLSLSSSCGL